MQNLLWKKFIAFTLALSMLAGYLPAGAAAQPLAEEGEPIYILAGGDFQSEEGHSRSAANVTAILSQIETDHPTMDGFLFVGDYDYDTHSSGPDTADGIQALMGAVQDSYPNLNHSSSILVQGNHDFEDGNLDSTGGHEFDGYSVFVLNEDDYPNYGGEEAKIDALATQLENYLHDKMMASYDKPIFITSHLPLAYSPRTNTSGDAIYSYAVANHITFFPEPMGLMEDRIEISTLENILNVHNLTQQDIPGPIHIYYKNTASGQLYGGITYRITLDEGLAAGQIQQLVSSHFSTASSKIMFVTCGE